MTFFIRTLVNSIKDENLHSSTGRVHTRLASTGMDNGKHFSKAEQSLESIGFITAPSVMVTNMISTGVFTSLGLQRVAIQSPFAIFLLWLFGGVITLCGAAVYAVLALRFPRSGCEYNFPSNRIHPMA
jgi:hypothetical protein